MPSSETLPQSARRGLLLFAALNLLIALANVSPLASTNALSSPAAFAFAAVAMVGYLGGVAIVFAGALALAARGPRSARAVAWIAPVLFTLFQTALLIDVRIFRMFRFHFNGLVWQTLTAPGGWDSLHIGTGDLAALALLVVVVALAQWAVLRLFVRRSERWTWAAALTWKRAAIVLLVIGAADRATYAAYDLMRDYQMIRAVRVVPGYQRFTIRQFAKRWFGWEVGETDVAFKGPKSTGLKYPVAPLAFETPAKKPNVLWIVLESWRSGAFGPENTPRIWEISRKGHTFENHVSGGNNTSFGIFSMFYGLIGSYRASFLAERRGPVLIDRMEELDYRFAIYSSFPMVWPEFRKYAFVDIANAVKDEWPHEESAKNDPLVIDELISFVDAGKDTGRPFFGFVLLDSSHTPYTFPPEFGKFQPYMPDHTQRMGVKYMRMKPDAEQVRNRYYNAILWEDHQVGRLWDALAARGLLEDTIILITGDHGEEFNEHGFWTHSGAYTPEQIRVPLILWWPGLEPRVVTRRTAHEDIPATFMEALGVKNPPSDYTQGHSLLDTKENPYVVACGWRDCALVDDEGYVIFGLEGQSQMSFDVLDRNYQVPPDPDAAIAGRSKRMFSVMQDMTVFLQ